MHNNFQLKLKEYLLKKKTAFYLKVKNFITLRDGN